MYLFGTRQTFEGGLYLPDHKTRTAKRPIETLAPTGPLMVPLSALGELPTTPVVAPGDRVIEGQPLAMPAAPESLCVSAPTSGRIVRFDHVWTALDGLVPCAVLEPDGLGESAAVRRQWESDLFLTELVEKGVVCPNPRKAAHVLIAEAVAAGVTELIVNALETEPYLTADLRTMVEMPARLIEATCEIADAIGALRVRFAMPDRHRRLVRRMVSEAAGRLVEIVPLAEKYPQCHPTVLIKTLLEVEVPIGRSMLDVGVLVVPLAMIRAAAEALLDGRAVTHAVLTVSGDCLERPGTYRVPVGTPIQRLLDHVGPTAPIAQIVSGGPLTGVGVQRPDAVVTIDASALLCFSRPPEPQPIECIHCGWCVEDCPVGLEPVSLLQLEAMERISVEDRERLLACIDCGLCSYVCPSELPLAAAIRRTRRRAAGGPTKATGPNP